MIFIHTDTYLLIHKYANKSSRGDVSRCDNNKKVPNSTCNVGTMIHFTELTTAKYVLVRLMKRESFLIFSSKYKSDMHIVVEKFYLQNTSSEVKHVNVNNNLIYNRKD